MIKVVITGSNALLGQSLLNLLLKDTQKYQVFGFSRGGKRSKKESVYDVSIDAVIE
jgi:dTDP-4-dehydrorhamnose reductase|tara:strand:+ start:251 stop:418 length:168 start_codon:yes stop_codon:yes gene_type:complete